MREVKASEVQDRLPSLLDAVEQGETVVITRRGRPVARLVPAAAARPEGIADAIARLKALRAELPGLALEDLLDMRHEGHRF